LKELPLDANTEELKRLGPGIPLFFDYTKFIFATHIACYLVYGLYTTIYNLTGTYCDRREAIQPGYCGAMWKTRISAGNILFYEVNPTEKFLACVVFILMLGLRIYFFKQAR
jgi:hypothetical protein